jgi:phosphoserine phosphatase RsbU/P
VVVVIATADLLDATSSVVGSFAIAPFMACVLCTPARTAMVSVVSLVVGMLLLATPHDHPDPLTVAVRVGVLVAAAVAAPLLARERTRREQRIADLTRVAEAAQLAVLTPIPPVAGPSRLASAYQSASREALIGGDLYGVVETPHGVRLMIGDVRGKGIDAVRIAAVALAGFREGTHQQRSLTELAEHCDRQLRPNLVVEDFVTALFADIGNSGEVELICCGHPAPMHARGEQRHDLEVDHPGTPLGFPLDLRIEPEPYRFWLQQGDRLLFYTDGLVEARTPRGEFVEADSVVGDIGTADFEQALGNVVARLHSAAREVRDDLALLLLEFTGPVVDPDGDAERDLDEARSEAQVAWSDQVGRVLQPQPAVSPLVSAGA